VAAEREPTLDAVLGTTVQAAHAAVAKTPYLLPILREAGVVDSGGQGLFRLLEGAHAFLTGAANAPAPRLAGAAALAMAGHGAGSHAGAAPAYQAAAAGAGLRDEGFGFETMFLAQAGPDKPLAVDAIRDYYESIGESVLVAGDARAIKVHIHNERPDLVLAYALGLGTLSKISVENLDQQASDVRETRAAAFATDGHENGTGPAVALAATGPAGAQPTAPAYPSADAPPLAVVAVAAGEGLAAIFRDFGVQRVVYGGQTANPSTGELLRIARLAKSREVLLLPNNPNVRLAAEQAAQICTDRRLVVVPTRNAAEGIAAVLAYKPTADAAANVGPMTAAGRGLATVQVTEAVRDAKIGGRKVKKGQTIALDPDDGLVAVDSNRDKAVMKAVATFPAGFGIVTLYYGDGATLAEAEALAQQIGLARPALEQVDVVHGGQPHYRYLISAE
jgi:hypothetical protein